MWLPKNLETSGLDNFQLVKGPALASTHNMHLAYEGILKDPLSVSESAMPYGLGTTVLWR